MTSRSIFALSLTILLTFLSSASLAVEDIVVDYSFQGSAPADLSNMKATLNIAQFIDSRSIDNPRLLTSADLGLGSADGYQLDQALTGVIADALYKGFASGNARLVDADGEMSLAGELQSVDAKVVDRGGVESIQITLRTNIQLRSGSRMIWQTTLYGRGTTPATDGIKASIHAALNRTIGELLTDDYFLAEIR